MLHFCKLPPIFLNACRQQLETAGLAGQLTVKLEQVKTLLKRKILHCAFKLAICPLTVYLSAETDVIISQCLVEHHTRQNRKIVVLLY